MRIEPVETLLPRSSCVLGPCRDLDQRFRLQLAWAPLSVAAATDQTRPLEDLQVPGDGRETDRERLGQFEHACLTVGQPTHDRTPRRIRQGGEDDVESIRGHHGHRYRRSCRYFTDQLFNRTATYCQDIREVRRGTHRHPADRAMREQSAHPRRTLITRSPGIGPDSTGRLDWAGRRGPGIMGG